MIPYLVDIRHGKQAPSSVVWTSPPIANWPRTVCSIEGHDVNGQPLKGIYLGTERTMAEGFKANCAFFKLDFLDKDQVALGRQFRELLPLVWMKSGAVGKCPELQDDDIPDMLVLPENKMAVLVNEQVYAAFAQRVNEEPRIETVYVVTDSERMYREMVAGLNAQRTFQLYRDYLDNFRINKVR